MTAPSEPSMWEIDHPLIAVSNLDAAISSYKQLGFSPSPRMKHSFGTANALIMFQSNFIELLGDFDHVVTGSFRGIEQLAEAVAHGDGCMRVGLMSSNIESDAATLRKRGVAVSGPISFRRALPADQSFRGDVECSVIDTAYSPHRLELFLSQQHRPEAVWIDDWMRHPNGAIGLTKITYEIDDLQAHLSYFAAFLGDPIILHDGTIEFENFGRTSVTLQNGSANAVVALSIAVADLNRTGAFLRSTGVTFSDMGQSMISVSAAVAHGVELCFHEGL